MGFFGGFLIAIAAIAVISFLLGNALVNGDLSGKTVVSIIFTLPAAVITGTTVWSYIRDVVAWRRHFKEHGRDDIGVMDDKSLWTNINKVYWWVTILVTIVWVTIFTPDEPAFFRVFSGVLFAIGIIIDIATKKVFQDEDEWPRRINRKTILQQACYLAYYLVIWFVVT